METSCQGWRASRPVRLWLDRLLLVLALLAAASLLPLRDAFAQTAEADPPSRVARISEIGGTAWIYHPDNGDWLQATPNLPLTTGDTLATEAGARAELQIGSTTLRLDSGTEIEVAALDDSRVALRLRAGALSLRLRNPAETGPVEVGTEEGRFQVLAAGRYRFDRGSRGSFVAVDTGQVRYEYASSALTVTPGQRAEFWIDAGGTAQYSLGGMTYDAFTAWNNERDRAAERSSVASRYVSPEMTGVEDLDRYGNWEPNADYGAVWIPANVSSDWAPYSAGRWVWVRPWGWTWVDDAPWGFAPFHYGRWVNLRNRWCWTPGVREPRPVYAPALVGWVGPPRGGVSVGGGVGPAVGWFPLAPREVFVPGYRSSPGYIRTINTPYVRRGDPNLDIVLRNPQAPREFENRRWPRAVTVVPATAFGERRSLAPVAAQYRDAPWTREFARPNGPSPALTGPPVGAPPMAANRPADARPSRPPPGFVEPRAGGSRPETSPGTAGAAGNRPELQRPPGGGDLPGRYGRPDRAEAAPPNLQRATGGPAEAGAPPSPVRPLPVRPGVDPAERSIPPGAVGGRGGLGPTGAPGVPGTPGSPPLTAPAAAAAPIQRPVSPAAEVQEPGRMRPFPVNRGDRRENDGRFGEGRPPQAPPRSETVAPPAPSAIPGPAPTPLANPGPTPALVRPAPSAEAPPGSPGRRPGESPGGPPSERGIDRSPLFRQGERPGSQPLRPEVGGARPEPTVPRPAEVQTAPPPSAAQAPRPAAPPPAPRAVEAPPAPPPRPVEAPAPARRVEGPRVPAGEPQRPAVVEPQRPAVAPERRNEPNASR